MRRISKRNAPHLWEGMVFRGVFEGMWRRGGGSALGVESGLG